MEKDPQKVTYKDLLIRGFIEFFLIGIFFSIVDDKTVLAYFLKTKTIVQILLFTIFGGLLYSFTANIIRKKLDHRKMKSSDDDK